jgi:ArsR family transcriptional regulator
MNRILSLKEIEKISKALGDPYRLKIMDLINKEKDWMQCGCIVNNFDLAQSTVSHHVNQLVDADLLIADKDGRNVKYHVNKEVFSAYISYLSHFNKD